MTKKLTEKFKQDFITSVVKRFTCKTFSEDTVYAAVDLQNEIDIRQGLLNALYDGMLGAEGTGDETVYIDRTKKP